MEKKVLDSVNGNDLVSVTGNVQSSVAVPGRPKLTINRFLFRSRSRSVLFQDLPLARRTRGN